MSLEILVNITSYETRVVVVEQGVLQEIYVERANKLDLVGNIYKGRVVRVLPGMQAAFVDIGLGKAAFLHAADVFTVTQEVDNDSITDKLTEGQEIIVQVIKDPIGTKGARLTTQLSISSRDLVFMPGLKHVGLSLKIEDEIERQRLEDLLAFDTDKMEGGIIIRTAAEGAQSLEYNKNYLYKTWNAIKKRSEKAKCGEVIYEDLQLSLRILRDLVRPNVERIRIDSATEVNRANAFIKTFIPDFQGAVECYLGDKPIFDLYGIEDEIQKALQRKVQLKSGGYLVFDQTEAMSIIDVNTGAFVGRRNLEETIFKTNLEAAVTIARQLRLRNLGGIVIVDFIDMATDEHKRQVVRTLEKEINKDQVKVIVSEITSLGLVQMTRKRTHDSLENVLCETCSVCDGSGSIKTAETVCYEIFREILRAARAYDSNTLLVSASQAIVERLLDEESTNVAKVEDMIKKTIKFQVESLYFQEQYDVVLL